MKEKKFFRQFRSLEKRVLVCTNVGARGLDIMGCTTVVNYDVPIEVIKKKKKKKKRGEGGIGKMFRGELLEMDIDSHFFFFFLSLFLLLSPGAKG